MFEPFSNETDDAGEKQNIIGIGIDTVNVNRFSRLIMRNSLLLDKLFVESEKVGSIQSLAGRFAAKEAFIKAINPKWIWPYSYLVLKKNHLSKPYALYHRSLPDDFRNLRPTFSISHDDCHAQAICIVTKLNRF